MSDLVTRRSTNLVPLALVSAANPGAGTLTD
jgi:hypothetical protein